MTPKQPSRLKTWLKRFGYLLLAIVLFVGLIYALGWYGDWKELRRINELLADLDRAEPGWRWKDFQPTALKPGQENGALRFVEFGKTIDPKLIKWPDLQNEVSLNVDEHPNWLSARQTREWLGHLLQETKEQQKHIKSLCGLKNGAVAWKRPPPFAHDILIAADRFDTGEDGEAFERSRVLISLLQEAAANQGNGELAIDLARANLALVNTTISVGGASGLSYHTADNESVIQAIQRTLALTQPSETALAQLQKDCCDWPSFLLRSDDIRFERAWMQALLDEALNRVDADVKDTLNHWRTYYRWKAKTGWKAFDDWVDRNDLFLPSATQVYCHESTKHVRFYQKLLHLIESPIDEWSSKWYSLREREDASLDGKAFEIYFMSRWTNAMHRMLDTQTKLRALKAGLACERYRLRFGHWPEKWIQLVPDWLGEIPKNVKTHEPLILKKLSDGLVIYGLGYDHKDNGGDVLRFDIDLSDRISTSHIPQDIGFRLFDPAARRQPAPPKPEKGDSKKQ